MSARNLVTFIARMADKMVLVATMDNSFDLEGNMDIRLFR